MELTRPATNESETLQYFPAFYRGGIAGRIDHWIMPSPAKGSFTLAMSATDFTGRLRIQPTDRFVVRFNGQPITADLNVDMKGQRQWRFWAGTLESNPLRLADCPQSQVSYP